jgi:hypothetical protein
VREIDDDEGQRLVRIVRRGSGSVVTWRRAQMVLLSAQGMNVAARPSHRTVPCLQRRGGTPAGLAAASAKASCASFITAVSRSN